MSNDAELNRLYEQEASAESSIAGYESQQAAIDAKLERLRAAKTKLVGYEDDARELKSQVSDEKDQDIWKGTKYNSYQGMVAGLEGSYNSYISGIDSVIDAINTAMTQLENERRNIGGWLGQAISWLHEIRNEIVNFFN